jgi:SAM-dependent methyltransferase
MSLGNVFRTVRGWRFLDLSSKLRWDAGVPKEVTFWESFLETRGLHWPEDYRARLDPVALLRRDLWPYIEEVPGDTVRILDVGAGPLTVLGKTHPSKRLEITATDPLAPHYDRLLAKHRVLPPVRTVPALAERLTKHFPRDRFDLVTAINCLDHSYNPLRAIREMLAVVKPACCAFLSHSENEAEKQNWEGLHQWNFSAADGEFTVRSRRSRINLTRALNRQGTVTVLTERNGWIDVLIRKHPR